jgi:sec-independent protein translocase protein TatB
MELFGVGPLEVLLVILLALVLFGPQDIAKNARAAGRFLNRLYKSEGWRTMVQASSTLRNLPNRLAREAAVADMEDLRKTMEEAAREAETPPPAAESTGEAPPPPTGMAAWVPPGATTADPQAEEAPAPPPPTADAS